MRINFFEEFPTKKNLDKVNLIKFPSLLFIAAKNLDEFKRYEQYVKKLNKKIQVGYWPILSKEEGYWISPFSDSEALKRIIKELEKEKKILTVLWDCEFPLKKKLLIPTPNLFKNKKLIVNFLHNTKHSIYTAEYGRSSLFLELIFRFYGLRFSFLKKRIPMLYTSMAKGKLKETYRENIKKNPIVGLGTITIGILGNEPKLKPEELDLDLKLAKESDAKEVFIFRLGGLNKKYLDVIKKYL
jgi:hypothetical protein